MLKTSVYATFIQACKIPFHSLVNVHRGQTQLSENIPKFKQLKLNENLGMVAYTFNPSTLEA